MTWHVPPKSDQKLNVFERCPVRRALPGKLRNDKFSQTGGIPRVVAPPGQAGGARYLGSNMQAKKRSEVKKLPSVLRSQLRLKRVKAD